ncbi:MAG: hypothetical protein ACTSPY_05870 [Candidatus Helarchaeota archaeon]
MKIFKGIIIRSDIIVIEIKRLIRNLLNLTNQICLILVGRVSWFKSWSMKEFYIDLRLEIDFSIILEIFFSDFSINLIIFPGISATIISFGQGITLCTYV